MHKKVFIIGNGFDLNLGWKTSYRSFIESDLWPLKDRLPNCPLGSYLKDRIDIERWYDLEQILKEYASDGSERAQADPRDEIFFNVLKTSLAKFIMNAEEATIDKDSLAVKILDAILQNGFFSSIYSFNYTSLYKVAQKAGIKSGFNYQSVHGSIDGDPIILGISDIADIVPGYSYLKKVFNPRYRPHHIRFDLQECDEVVFFGHSLGDNDYPYFSDFFESQSQCLNRSQSKRITIFTKDNFSRIQLLEQLHLMNKGKTEHLINDNEFNIIMADYPDNEFLDVFFKHLVKESRAEEKLYCISFPERHL